SCEEAKVGNSARDVECASKRNWLASIDRLSLCELFQIALDQVGDAQKNCGTIRRRLLRPIGKRLLGCGNRKIDIVRVAVRHLRIRFASPRFNVVEVFSTDRLDKLAIDKVLNLE